MKPADLSVVWGEDGHLAVEDFIRRQVLTLEEARVRLKEAGVERCYSDPLLRHRGTFATFVKRLVNLGLVDLSLERGVEEVELFCVKKKQNKLRLIVDCRRSNAWFREPENVKLTSGDSLGRLELGENDELFVCSADLQNAFYTMSMPVPLRRYFCLRPVRAGQLGVSEVNGVKLSKDALVTPRMAVLPMGWAWALWWCQRLHERIAERSGLSREERLQDFTPPPKGKFWHVQYVDNLHVMGTDPVEVQSRFRGAVAELKKAGLTVHEEEEFEEETKILGWEYDKAGVFRPTRTRIWRVRKALRYLVGVGRATGQQLERLLGRMTFIALGRRETLSIFGEVYTFIRRHYKQETPLWKSVRRELVVWDGLAPLIFQNLRSPWGDQLCSVDASEWGLGVCTSEIGESVASSLSRYNERWRFRSGAASRARTFISEENSFGAETFALDEEPMEIVPAETFSSVPFEVVNRSWKVVGRHRWQHVETMPVYEARSTLHAVRHLMRNSENFGKRHVVLSDSMTAILAYSKGRAHAHRLRRVVQQTSAYVLATGSNVYVRWIPSEWNPADNPSRGRRVPSQPVRVLVDGAVPQPTSGGDMAWKSEKGEEEAEGEGSKATSRASATRADSLEVGHGANDPREEEEKESSAEADTCSSCRSSWGKQQSERGSCGTGDKAKISESLEDFSGVEKPSAFQRHRPSPGGVSSRTIPSGGGPVGGQLCGGSCPSSTAGTTSKGLLGKSAAGLERMAKPQPPKEPNAIALRGDLLGGGHGYSTRQAGGGPCNPSYVLPVPEAHRVSAAPCTRCGKTSSKRRQSLPTLEHSAPSHGGRDSFEDQAVGRGSYPRFGSYGKSGARHVHGAEVGTTWQARAGLQCDKPRAEQHAGRTMASPPTPKPRQPPHVSAPTWGGDLRAGQWPEKSARSAAARPLEGGEKFEKLRERRQVGSAVRKSRRGGATTMRGRQSSARPSAAQPALSIGANLKVPVFLEFFSGSGRLGKAVSRYAGMVVLLWDICYGPEYDLTCPAVQHMVLGWIKNGSVIAGHLGTPCQSFSRARDRPGGPPRLRSDAQPLGLEGLKPWDATKVKNGNLLMRFTVRVMLLAISLALPFTLENPARSRLWLCPPVLALLRRRSITCQVVEYCMFGMPWKKSTLFVGSHLSLVRLSPFRCVGARRGLCRYSNIAHIPLAGQTPDGRWLTHIAEPYPYQLCRILAGCFRDFQVATIAGNFSKHLMI